MINHLFRNEAIIVLIKNIYGNENFEKDILKLKKKLKKNIVKVTNYIC